jgi:uncharacterized phage protein (TIGR01671 family)
MVYFDNLTFMFNRGLCSCQTHKNKESQYIWFDEWGALDYIIMQYTGLKDKKNKEIYEGDLVEFEDQDDIAPESSWIAAIQFKDGCFVPWLSLESRTVKVIGNIYENPELTEGAGE